MLADFPSPMETMIRGRQSTGVDGQQDPEIPPVCSEQLISKMQKLQTRKAENTGRTGAASNGEWQLKHVIFVRALNN